jgi:hypothetical protein
MPEYHPQDEDSTREEDPSEEEQSDRNLQK